MSRIPLTSRAVSRQSPAEQAQETQADSGMAIITQADTIAAGENTYTATATKITVIDYGRVTLARGFVEATAAADSPEGTAFASAETGLTVGGADLLLAHGRERSGASDGTSYDYSAKMFRAVDIPSYSGPAKIVDLGARQATTDISLSLDGNVAEADFDVSAFGENSLADVDAFTLAVDDQLSVSTLQAIAAVD